MTFHLISDHPGSIVGFADSNSSQKLLLSSKVNNGQSSSSAAAVTVVSPGSAASDARCRFYEPISAVKFSDKFYKTRIKKKNKKTFDNNFSDKFFYKSII
jgi:phosphoribosylamine-glycine ligase